MGRPILLATVTFLMFTQIFSAPTTQELDDSSTMATDTAEPNLASEQHKDNQLEVDASNPILGDIPILPDHNIDIINRRCKSLHFFAAKDALFKLFLFPFRHST